MTPALLVNIDGTRVGRLWLDEKRQFCFCYDRGWLEHSRIPLSLSLPLRSEPYLHDESHSFFANLLPEEKMRSLVARNLGISANNDYGLLERIGGDCAGAVSLFPEGDEPSQQTGTYQPLSLDQLNQIIRSLPQRPLLAGQQGIRLSLAGAQKKLPVYHDGMQYYLGQGAVASNLIIKPAMDELPGTVENEAYCMALARAVGLDLPRSYIHHHQDLRVFVIERFDRLHDSSGIRRLHQEDFCQALTIPPEFKYEAEGGPSLAACFNLLRTRSSRSGKDLLSLLDWVIFNYLIGNSDAHAKNISLLLLDDGPRLAPFYDMLSTRVYAHYGLAEGLAMKIGGETNPQMVRAEHWQVFANEVGIKPKLVLTRLRELSRKVEAHRLELFKGAFAPYRCDILHQLMELISDQCGRMQRTLGN
jgi:serine/threonine-protein kinase HipA